MNVHLADGLDEAGVGKRTGIDRLEAGGCGETGNGILGPFVVARNENLQRLALARLDRQQLREDGVEGLHHLCPRR